MTFRSSPEVAVANLTSARPATPVIGTSEHATARPADRSVTLLRSGISIMNLESINNLRMVADLCETGQTLPIHLAEWLADALRSFLEQRSVSLNDAFGLRAGRGGVPWHVEENIRKRDSALRQLCTHHFLELSLTGQARLVHRLSLRYAASSWRFDRERKTMPNRYRGTPNEFLWLAFKSEATMPVCTRQLRNILNSGRRLTSAAKFPQNL